MTEESVPSGAPAEETLAAPAEPGNDLEPSSDVGSDLAPPEMEGSPTAVAGPDSQEVDKTETLESSAGSEVLAAVESMASRLESRLDSLSTLFDREIRAEATREKVVDRLHAELQEYKQDLLLSTLRPVFIDLIQLHDDMGKVASPANDAQGPGRMVELLQGFQQGIEDILYRQGVEPFQLEGDQFDPRRQRAVSTVPTDDPTRARTVAARLRKGFQAGERVIRPEIVSVYSYKP
ncbi:MAG: nucleotide exchange factor GrpE [Isosphaeraceae bacterium]